MHDHWLALLLAQGQRIERKLDALIAALASDEDADESVRSLDGQAFAPRDETKGLG